MVFILLSRYAINKYLLIIRYLSNISNYIIFVCSFKYELFILIKLNASNYSISLLSEYNE